ncbi:RNA polymerase sigma factor (sigma-70 family) [Pseudoxanthomonas japonensis]|uniref:RNA polymerase sigma factor n=1 Tax=Pseudoxanthomonas japonensis TaxID=69284 RepID=UPI002855D80D|nr:sigma-70 family RNA polymerase sigma factor [Pseudoxanthomonas japonensis]MDR7069085.1 RNA polymerase sigma factor (sigma-70 family) [Pseudoxanthomonas japonensis]
MTAIALDMMLQTELPAATRGSQEAYGRIVHACQNTVTAIALAITRDVQASEDIAQEAFLKAWQQLDRLKNSASFLPWLRQITRNLARDWLRAQHGRPMSGQVAEIAIGMAADPGPSPDERLLQTEEELVATEIISSLPEDSRETLLLFYREGQSSQQVADLLGLSDAAVRKRLSRARTMVRDELLQRFGEFARSTAPGAAFTMIVLGGLVGAMPAASAATVIGSGVLGTGLAGKLGTGGMTTGGVTGGVAGGSLGVIFEQVTQHPGALGGAIGGIVAGLIGYAFTWWYLARFCQTAQQRVQVRRFMALNATSGAAWLFCLMLATVLAPGWQAIVAITVVGMCVINYQYLATLPRIMAPILAHPANARRRRGYDYVIGRKAVVLSSALAIAAILFALLQSGRFEL